MPSLDIAIAQSCFQNHFSSPRAQALRQGRLSSNFLFTDVKRFGFASKLFHVPYKVRNASHLRVRFGQILIKAVATMETRPSVQNQDRMKGKSGSEPSFGSHPPTADGDSSDVNEKEKLRRMRISKANKGNTPWNLGRKHSPETIRLIRERTRIAMQDPKVKMKLVNSAHVQSKETRVKIGVAVRIGWQKRREKQMLQETLYFQWENLIADASRKGFLGEVELQWDSYQILDEQLRQEWFDSVEKRKKLPKPMGNSRRAPKSIEQRRKIAQAISAKWSDPEYRAKVCSSLAKYHGITDVGERKPRRISDRKPSSRKRSSINNSEVRSQPLLIRVKRSRGAKYKDPLASSKLQMIKNIRADRASAETKRNEAIERARSLIAEAEKATKALEVAAMRNPLARASFVQARKLIDEAIHSIGSIDCRPITSHSGDQYAFSGLVNPIDDETSAVINGVDDETSAVINGVDDETSVVINGVDDETSAVINGVDGVNGSRINGTRVNGSGAFESSYYEDNYFDMLSPQDQRHLGEEPPLTNTNALMSQWNLENSTKDQDSNKEQEEQVQDTSKIKRVVPLNSATSVETSDPGTPNKKWICGRLVVVEGD